MFNKNLSIQYKKFSYCLFFEQTYICEQLSSCLERTSVLVKVHNLYFESSYTNHSPLLKHESSPDFSKSSSIPLFISPFLLLFLFVLFFILAYFFLFFFINLSIFIQILLFLSWLVSTFFLL